jgi:hypothetical protein
MHGEPAEWLQRLAVARGCSPNDLRLRFVREAHRGLRVGWKDLSRGMAAVMLPADVTVAGRSVPLVPNQTVYSLPAATEDDAHVWAAVLNSTIAGALLLSEAERAKDSFFRYFGRTVARLPWPTLDGARADLAQLSRAAHAGAVIGPELDDRIANAYGLTSEQVAILHDFLEERLR